jgi:membrane-bound lytic murein transglycosylase F
MKKILYILLFTFLFLSCNGKKQEVIENVSDLEAIKKQGVLRVATLSRSISFFVLNEQDMGYEYELADRFSKSLELEMEVVIARDMNDLVEKLVQKEVDLIAYPLIITNEFKEKVQYTEHVYFTKQFLIQSKKKGEKLLSDVTELIGKEVCVVENSKYHDRLINLNNEVGGGIIIRTVSNETDEEELIEMVAKNKIPFTVSDENIALINQTYFDNIDISLPVSFDQRAAWAVGLDSPELCDTVNEWFKQSKNSYIYQYLYHKYFEEKKNKNRSTALYINRNMISVFDDLFKKYAQKIGWDWRLLASIAYQESNFNPDAQSWAGAQGLMQLMPRTASLFGAEDASDPKQSVKAAVNYLQNVNRTFSYIEDEKEREKFVLASYNAGVGHIKDAIALTEKYHKNPYQWDNNVAEFILLKSNPEYFNDPVVKFGYLRGEEVYNFVNEVLERYEMYKEVIKK